MDASFRLHRRRGRGQRGAIAEVEEEADGEEDIYQGWNLSRTFHNNLELTSCSIWNTEMVKNINCMNLPLPSSEDCRITQLRVRMHFLPCLSIAEQSSIWDWNDLCKSLTSTFREFSYSARKSQMSVIIKQVNSNLGWETLLPVYVPLLPRPSASKAVWLVGRHQKKEMCSLNLNFNFHACWSI